MSCLLCYFLHQPLPAFPIHQSESTRLFETAYIRTPQRSVIFIIATAFHRKPLGIIADIPSFLFKVKVIHQQRSTPVRERYCVHILLHLAVVLHVPFHALQTLQPVEHTTQHIIQRVPLHMLHCLHEIPVRILAAIQLISRLPVGSHHLPERYGRLRVILFSITTARFPSAVRISRSMLFHSLWSFPFGWTTHAHPSKYAKSSSVKTPSSARCSSFRNKTKNSRFIESIIPIKLECRYRSLCQLNIEQNKLKPFGCTLLAL